MDPKILGSTCLLRELWSMVAYLWRGMSELDKQSSEGSARALKVPEKLMDSIALKLIPYPYSSHVRQRGNELGRYYQERLLDTYIS